MKGRFLQHYGANYLGEFSVAEASIDVGPGLRVQVFGETLTLAGYPPWTVRFSEIYHMGDLAHVTQRQLTGALQRYCRTSQRFGT